MAKPSRRRVAAVFAAGAVASIATSVIIPEWELVAEEPFATSLDETMSTIVYDVTAELVGPVPIASLYGSVTVTLDVMALNDQFGEVVVNTRLKNLAPNSGVEDFDAFALQPLSRHTAILGSGAFFTCEASPCIERYELVIERMLGAAAPTVTVDAVAELSATAPTRDSDDDNPQPPPGTAISIEIVPRGPLP